MTVGPLKVFAPPSTSANAPVLVRLVGPLMTPSSSTTPVPVPVTVVALASVRLFEITNPPVPFCSRSGASPAKVIALPVIYCVAAALLVSPIRLVISPVSPLLAVYAWPAVPPKNSITLVAPTVGAALPCQLLFVPNAPLTLFHTKLESPT